jgi:hypothetical protein
MVHPTDASLRRPIERLSRGSTSVHPHEISRATRESGSTSRASCSEQAAWWRWYLASPGGVGWLGLRRSHRPPRRGGRAARDVVVVEARVRSPLLPLRVLTDRNRAGAFIALGLNS